MICLASKLAKTTMNSLNAVVVAVEEVDVVAVVTALVPQAIVVLREEAVGVADWL